ncbi:MAG: DNA polymerase III subunit beta [candidate division KSB1 bacterium]|nr:DNA polymerase III subunit beta [candidate division KSB1 bacterium]MDZ7301961.1 DNA polymerase III subunit beta [candidate division KSB1 bacterium]MDZ7312366.1 DNA polymerase III subunit beta [candidate division KSB1 bacterium]
MKFIVNKTELFQCLQRIIGVIPVKTTIPVLTNILFELDGQRLRLTGTDLEVSIITFLSVRGEQDGAAAFPAKRLFDIIRELPELPLTFETDNNNRLLLTTEKGSYKIAGESSEEYPHIASETFVSQISYSTARFLRMIEKTIFAVSTDELRTTLMGVLLEFRPHELRLVATDGHRLAKISDLNYFSPTTTETKPDTVVKAPELGVQQAIIPTKALQMLMRNSDQADQIDVALSENHITFRLGSTTIYSKLINGQYPSYERVIPQDNDLTMIVDRDLLAASVRRVAIFANQITHQIRWSLEPGKIAISAEDVEVGGEAREILAMQYDGKAMDIGYNAHYVQELLRHIDSEEVIFRLKDPGSAAIIEPVQQKEGENYMMLLMPIRLNDATG